MSRRAWLAVLLGAAGCTQRLASFESVSAKKLAAPPAESGEKALGEDCVWYALFVPLGTPSVERAYARAVGDWDGLADASIEASWWWALATGKACYRVRGVRVRVPREAAEPEAPAPPAEETAPPEPAPPEPEPAPAPPQ